MTYNVNDSKILLEILLQNASNNTIYQLGMENFTQITEDEYSNGSPTVSNNSISVDVHVSPTSVDDGDDSEDLEILDEKVSESNKVKTIEIIHQIVVCISYYLSFLAAD